MDWGINRDFRLRFELFECKMSLGPHVGFRTFNEHIKDVIRVNNRISDLNYGLHVGYSIFQSKDRYFDFTNFFEFNYSHIENNLFNNSKTQKINIAKGNAFSMVAGYRIIYKWAFLETRYSFLN